MEQHCAASACYSAAPMVPGGVGGEAAGSGLPPGCACTEGPSVMTAAPPPTRTLPECSGVSWGQPGKRCQREKEGQGLGRSRAEPRVAEGEGRSCGRGVAGGAGPGHEGPTSSGKEQGVVGAPGSRKGAARLPGSQPRTRAPGRSLCRVSAAWLCRAGGQTPQSCWGCF